MNAKQTETADDLGVQRQCADRQGCEKFRLIAWRDRRDGARSGGGSGNPGGEFAFSKANRANQTKLLLNGQKNIPGDFGGFGLRQGFQVQVTNSGERIVGGSKRVRLGTSFVDGKLPVFIFGSDEGRKGTQRFQQLAEGVTVVR